MALLDYKCPNCGGAIQFNAEAQEMVCPYCDTVMDVAALKAMDADLAQQQQAESIDWGYNGGQWQEGEQDAMAVYTCKSCSGEIVGDETLGATSCPFCGNPVVMTSKFSGALRPDLVIPFKLGKDAALKALQKHYFGKKLLPKVFKDKNHLDEVKGVYVPFWLFNADADAKVTYKGTKVKAWSDSKYDYTETSIYSVYRAGGIGFDSVPVDGSTVMDDALMESIEPYAMKDAVDFQTAYLAGYFANKYDVDANQSIDRANERVKKSTGDAFRSTVTGYNSVTAQSTNIHLKNSGVKYALLPVWLLSTTWQGQNFLFAMNGQSGKIVGNLPMDKKLYKSWFFKIFGVSAVVLVILSLFITCAM